MANNILDRVESGQLARLIPTVADSKKEERATSSLLASFMVVPAYTQAVLASVGSPSGKRAKLGCYTEVVFKTNGEKKLRPDGLIVVAVGSKTWSAIVESKIGSAELKKEQVEDYLDLAREVGADAVITISNQFATLPTHHPIQVSKQKIRSVGLYHFSWLSLVSSAILVSDSKKIEDREQAYILSELVRYLQHESSGVTALTGMGKGWKVLCGEILQGATINRKADYVEQSVASWQQLLRFLSIRLSVAISKPVSIYLTRTRAKDPAVNFEEDVSSLLKDSCLSAEFEIPNAASRLAFSADILRRTINLSMRVDAPKDKHRATAPINWFTRQLKSEGETDLTIRAYWPKRIPMTSAPLSQALEDPTVLMPDNVSDLPVSLEVVRVIDLAARFRGSKTFVEEAEKAFPEFWANVGQRLIRWVPKPPKVKEPIAEASTDDIPPMEDLNTQYPAETTTAPLVISESPSQDKPSSEPQRLIPRSNDDN